MAPPVGMPETLIDVIFGSTTATDASATALARKTTVAMPAVGNEAVTCGAALVEVPGGRRECRRE